MLSHAVLDRKAGNLHLSAENLKRSIDAVGVDDGPGCATSFNCQVAFDVEVAGRVVIIVRPIDGEYVGSRWHDDRIRIGLRVRCLNG